MTGPLDFRTTARLSDMTRLRLSAGMGGADAAFSAVSFGESGLQPDSTVTALIMAVRIMKLRRSMPAGSSSSSWPGTAGAVPSSSRVVMSVLLTRVWDTTTTAEASRLLPPIDAAKLYLPDTWSRKPPVSQPSLKFDRWMYCTSGPNIMPGTG